MRDQDADCVAKPCCTSRCCNSMGSRAFCDTRTGGDAHWVCKGLHPRDERTKPGEAPQDAPHDVLGRRDAVEGTPSLCQEPSETDAGTSTLVGNAPLSVQNRTNLPDTLVCKPVQAESEIAAAERRVKPLARLLRCATALRVTAPLGCGSRRLVWPKGSFRPVHTARMPRFGVLCYRTLSNEIQNHWLIRTPPFPS